MQTYGSNKLKTALDICRRIENWPTALDLRIRKQHPGLRLLRFRNGLNLACRGATREWDVIHELIFAGGYGRAFDYLRTRASGANTLVLDLGGNIGVFSLLAAAQSPNVLVHAFEPGPPNYRIFEINRLANFPLSEQIILHREAVAGESRVTSWYFNEKNPGGSSLFGTPGAASFNVTITSLAEVVAAFDQPVTLAKIDIEGAEFEMLDKTPRETWQRIDAISLELHDDPAGQVSQSDFLRRLCDYGFQAVEERVCSLFLQRR